MKHRRFIIAAGLSLALAALACNIGTSAGSTPAISPATAAPAVVTVTAAPAQPTATPVPVQPDASSATPYTEPPTVRPPTAAPAGQTFDAACGTGDAALPAAPPKFADYATTILATLNAHSSVQAIDQGLRAWGGVTDKVGIVQGTTDLTGDGVADLLVVVQASLNEFPQFNYPGPFGLPSLPGDLYIYGCSGGTASLLYADYSTTDRITPQLLAVADLNGDKVNDIVYTTFHCGASTCFTEPHVVEWNASAQRFASIFPENYAAPSAKLDIKDVDGDGIREIIVHVGFQGSAGAGVQRSFDETYTWNGTTYVLKTRVVTSPQYPIHYLNDADAAVAKADYTAALPLYQHVINDPNPLTFMSQDEIPALKAYAYYRLMLAQALNGDAPSAQAAHDALIAQFANSPADAPGASFAHFADLFWKAYQSWNDVKAGCTAVIGFATSNADSYALLNNFGYANSFYKPEVLCPAGK